MPRVRWGIKSSDVDDFDREQQYKPYMGTVPPNAVYQWQVKKVQSVAGSRDKYPQLRVGLELIPRKGRDEGDYKGYYLMCFLPITEKTSFKYTPFLDALGVSGDDFVENTITDQEGNVKKIGRWRNDGKAMILGQLVERPDQNNVLRKEVTWMGPLEESAPDDDDDFDADDEYAEDEDIEGYSKVVENKRRELFGDDDSDEDEATLQRKARRAASRTSRQPATRRRTRRDEDEGDPF